MPTTKRKKKFEFFFFFPSVAELSFFLCTCLFHQPGVAGVFFAAKGVDGGDGGGDEIDEEMMNGSR